MEKGSPLRSNLGRRDALQCNKVERWSPRCLHFLNPKPQRRIRDASISLLGIGFPRMACLSFRAKNPG